MWNNSTENNSTSDGESTGAVQQALGLTLAVMLGLVILSLGCSVEVSKVWLNLKHPWGTLVGLVCQFVMMPLTSYLLALAFSVSPVQAVAIITIGSCPGGTISNMITYWLDGDMDLSITMTSVSTLLGMGTMPLNLYLYSRTWMSTGTMEVPYLNIGLASVSMIAPVTVGVFINYKWPKVARIVLKVGSIVGGLVMVGVGITSIILYDGLWNTEPKILIIGSVFPVLGYFIGFLISFAVRQPWKRCKTIATETGAQNMQICGTVLQLFFSPTQLSQVITLPLIYSGFQILTGLLLIIAHQIYKTYTKKLSQKYSMQPHENPAFESDTSCKFQGKTEHPDVSATNPTSVSLEKS